MLGTKLRSAEADFAKTATEAYSQAILELAGRYKELLQKDIALKKGLEVSTDEPVTTDAKALTKNIGKNAYVLILVDGNSVLVRGFL